MYIEQLYTNCLAEAAYYIESDGEAAIIDPIRDTEQYLQKAASRGAKIKYVFETHFHADFVSGHIDLARKTDAKIIFGPLAETGYEVINAKDNEEFVIGKVRIKTLHTPGHTPESTCFLLFDEESNEHAVFTGDTLFVGDVGRPDLLDGKMSKEELAGMMYDSLNSKLKTLKDSTIVYPAHGPGSACGKNIGKETWSTIGEQKQKNYAMQEMSKEKFIELVTAGLGLPPAYFFNDAVINKKGYDSLEVVLSKNIRPLNVNEFEQEVKAGALILDSRTPDEFEKAYIEDSLNIGLNGTYAVWVGTLINIQQPLIIVSESGKEEESISRLARIGFENVKGFLDGGINAWQSAGKNLLHIQSVNPDEFVKHQLNSNEILVDVRKPGEVECGKLVSSVHLSLTELTDKIKSLNKDQTYFLHCAGGYRSMIGASIMKAKGFKNVINIRGGYGKIIEAGATVVVPEKV